MVRNLFQLRRERKRFRHGVSRNGVRYRIVGTKNMFGREGKLILCGHRVQHSQQLHYATFPAGTKPDCSRHCIVVDLEKNVLSRPPLPPYECRQHHRVHFFCGDREITHFFMPSELKPFKVPRGSTAPRTGGL